MLTLAQKNIDFVFISIQKMLSIRHTSVIRDHVSNERGGSCGGYLTHGVAVHHRYDAPRSVQPRDERLHPGDRSLRLDDAETQTERFKY